MRLEIQFYGIENKGVISQDLIYVTSTAKIEDIKKIFCEKVLGDITQNMKDLNSKLAKQKYSNEFITKVKSFIMEQYNNFNIYKIKEIKEMSSELEIIEIEQELKEKIISEKGNKEILKEWKEYKGDDK